MIKKKISFGNSAFPARPFTLKDFPLPDFSREVWLSTPAVIQQDATPCHEDRWLLVVERPRTEDQWVAEAVRDSISYPRWQEAGL